MNAFARPGEPFGAGEGGGRYYLVSAASLGSFA